MRRKIVGLPDGRYLAEDYIDGDGVADKLTKTDVMVQVDGSDMLIDFDGTDEQVYGGVNAPMAVTRTAAYYAIKVTLNPGEPGTSGEYRPITVTAPEGTLLNPRYPAPVVAGNHETSSRIYDTVVKAIAEVDPSLAFGAGEGSANGFSYVSHETGQMNRIRTIGGLGACPNKDGITVRSSIGNSGIISFERIEEDSPYVVTEEFSLIPDSGGAGRHRGGNAARRVTYFDTDVQLVLTGERAKTQPFGVAGGQPGASAKHVHVAPDGEEITLKSKTNKTLEGGSRFIFHGAGGGGFGDPTNRPRDDVLEDVINGYVTPEKAEREYEVVVDPETFEIDHDATARLRDGQ